MYGWLCYTASRGSQQPLWPNGTRRHSPKQVGLWLSSCLGEDKPGSRARKNASFEIVHKSSRSALHEVPWSECTTTLFVQMSKAADWNDCWGPAGMNLDCQDSCADCCKPFPSSSSQSHSQWLSIIHISLQSSWDESRVGAPIMWPTMLGELVVLPWALHSHWRNWSLRGGLSMWSCIGMGKRRCSQCVTTSLNLLLQTVLVSVVHRVASGSPPCSRSFSVVSYSWIPCFFYHYKMSLCSNIFCFKVHFTWY